MFRIHCRLTVCMAEDALKDLVIVGIDMAIRAHIPSALMMSGINWKVLRVMIPGGLVPDNCIMASFAGSWKACRLVIGIGGVVIIRLMAGIAVGRCSGIAAGVAGKTWQHGMRAGQRKVGLIVVESRWRPGISRMTFGAVVTEVIDDMIWIGNGIEILLMTREAIRWGIGIAAGMAGDTLQR